MFKTVPALPKFTRNDFINKPQLATNLSAPDCIAKVNAVVLLPGNFCA